MALTVPPRKDGVQCVATGSSRAPVLACYDPPDSGARRRINGEPGEDRMRFGLAIIGFVGITVAFLLSRSLELDLRIAERYYDGAADEPWPVGESGFVEFVERRGNFVLFVVAAVVLGLVGLRGRVTTARRRRLALWLALVLAGPGATIHGLKYAWGRARPRDVYHWKQPEQYREWWQPAGLGAGRSFPSGHMGMALGLVVGAAWCLRRWWVRAAVILAASAWAVATGWARMADGAHYLTDLLGSCTIVLLLTVVLGRFLEPWAATIAAADGERAVGA